MSDPSAGSPAPMFPVLWPGSSQKSLVIASLGKILDTLGTSGWESLHPGVHFHWLYRDGEHGAAAAVIRFEPGARVPAHEHCGFEHIFVLQGSQTDENGKLNSGGLMVHAPGTRHSIFSEEGCLVLAIYEKRPEFDLTPEQLPA